MKLTHFISAMALLSLPMQAVTIFDESADGEASGDPNAPTALTLSLGSNEITGSVINTTAETTRDLFSFTIGVGQQLDAITVIAISQTPTDFVVDGLLDPGFFFLDAGTTTLIPAGDGSNSSEFLTGAQFGVPGSTGENANTPIGANLLTIPNITDGPGISAPLGAGDFVFGIQQTGPEVTGFTLDFQVSNVPEPSSIALLGLGSFAFLRRKR